MKKKFPNFQSDREAEEFVAKADLTEYDLSDFRPAHFEFEAKDTKINMRIPTSLLTAVKAAAAARGLPYQRFIRETLERAVAK
ncbi:MAG: CopG family antitoxin [Gemmatimonas sp.]